MVFADNLQDVNFRLQYKTMNKPAQKLSNLQLELLKVFSHNISDDELLDIRRMLAQYFMKRAIKAADKVWNEKGYSNELMNKWLKEDS